MLLHSGLQSSHRLSNVGLATAAGDAVHHLGLLLYRQGVLYFGQHGAEGLSRPEDNLHAKLPADPFDILTDAFYVGEHHQWGSVLFFQWQCLSCLHVRSGWFGGGAYESTGVPVLPQDSGEVVFFLPQVVLPSGDGSGSVEQAFDQSPLDLGWMVGVEVKVPVCVCGFPVDGDVQATIIPPLEQGVKKGEPSVLLHLHSEPDGWSHAVQVGQELFHCALLHNAAGVVYIPLPEAGLCRKFGMKVVFRSGQSLRSMLTKVKDPLTIEKQAKVVYRVPCSCGEAYIGETVRRLETRVKEHRDACQKGALEKSALAEHAWMNHHPIKWEEVSVIDRARTAKELLVKEAIHIRLNHPSLNRDEGLELPRCWMAALKNTGSVSNQRHVAPTDSAGDST